VQGCKALFNYIPKPCPEWRKHKKCILRDSCPQAHGYLEMIYHPLLYKTKMCESYQKSGVCRKYGIYCAKAHNLGEIRNLVKIYGWNWKRHYDLSLRKSGTKVINKSAVRFDKPLVVKHAGYCRSETILKYLEGFPSELSNSLRKLCLNEKQGLIGTQSNMKQNRSRVVDDFKQKKKNQTSESTSLFSPSPLFGVTNNVDEEMPNIWLEDAVPTTELYRKKFVRSENESSKRICESPCRSNSSMSEKEFLGTTLVDSPMSSTYSDFFSPTQSSKSAESNGSPFKSDNDNGLWSEDHNPRYLFDLDHDGIWSKHIFGF